MDFLTNLPDSEPSQCDPSEDLSVPTILPSEDAGFVSLGENCRSIDQDPSGKIGSSTIGAAMISNPHASIEERERQIRAKELELEQREIKIRISGNESTTMVPAQKEKAANWPHPKMAYVYHDIEDEVLEENRSLVRIAYLCWKMMSFGYLFNFLTISVAAFHGNYYQSGLAMSTAVFSALMYGAFSTASSFLLWYHGGIYKLCRKPKFSSKRWLLFKAAFMCHIVFSVLILIGAPWTFPSGGILFVITSWFSGDTLSAVMGAINAIIWAAVVLNSLVVYRVAAKYRERSGIDQVVEPTDFKAEIRKAVASMLVK